MSEDTRYFDDESKVEIMLNLCLPPQPPNQDVIHLHGTC
jgi:hypothetical protein